MIECPVCETIFKRELLTGHSIVKCPRCEEKELFEQLLLDRLVKICYKGL